jgi:hypothetical protein
LIAKRVKIIACCIFLSACSIQRDADLYPANDAALSVGTLRARFVAHGTGEGEAFLTMPDGEVLSGEYHINRSQLFGLGDIIVAAFTEQGKEAMLSKIHEYHQEASPGEVTIVGQSGKNGECQFYNDNINGHGFGAFKLWNGALYRLNY